MFGQLPEEATKDYQKALDIADEAGKEWKDVPTSDKGAWLGDEYRRGIRCLMIESICASFRKGETTTRHMDNVMKIPDAADMILKELGSLDAEVPDPLQVFPVEYSAFRIDHYVNAHRSIGLFHSKIAQVVAVGARIESDGKMYRAPRSLKSAAVQYIKAAALLPPRRPGHIQLHMDCYGTVRTSAAALFAWYGDRDRSRSGRLSRIVRHGHIWPSDLFILHDIANASLAASEPVFGPPESHRTIQRSHVTKYLSKVRLLISRGKGTENSVLLPCPDEQVSEETHLTALKPALAPEGDGDLEDGELLGYEAAEGPESESRASLRGSMPTS